MHGQIQHVYPHVHTPCTHYYTCTHTSHTHAAGDGGYDYDLIVIGGGSGGLACSKEGVALAVFASLPPSLLALPLPLPPSPFPFLPSASSPFRLPLKQTPDFYVFFPSFFLDGSCVTLFFLCLQLLHLEREWLYWTLWLHHHKVCTM